MPFREKSVIFDLEKLYPAPITRADTCKPLIGKPDSVLRPEFLQANQERKDDTDVLPFSGKLQLPSTEQVLKLYFFYRAQLGNNNDT